MAFDFHCFKMRTGWVLRRVKMFEMPASHMGALLQVPAPLLPTQLPANAVLVAAGNSSSALVNQNARNKGTQTE